jgi:two-component system, NarL family, sensor histidine kinase UhpB
MRTSPIDTPPFRARRDLPRRDVALVVAVTVLSIVVSAHFDLNEAFYALTRHAEYLQVDELPVGMLALLIGLIWLSWRRYHHAQRELQARRVAEATLAGVLRENRQLAKETLRIQEIERKHLARELHDELGQYLNAIKLDAVTIQDCEHDAAGAKKAAGAIIRSIDHLHGAVSVMIGRLRPTGLDELGLVAAIEHCVDHWRERLPQTHFQLSVTGDWEGLGEVRNLTIYRLIQEGLTNVYKHAAAKQVTIALERGPGEVAGKDLLRLSVADNGRGMDAGTRSLRFGISGMRERVEMAGGRFALDTSPGCGLRFEACLPAEVAAE